MQTIRAFSAQFLNGKVLTWPKDSSIDSARVIGVRDKGLYRLTGKLQPLVHTNVDLSELWHRRYAHLHYRALPALPRMVSGIPKLQVEHDGICRGCVLGKNVRSPYPSSDNRSKGILDLVHSDVCGPMAVESMSGCLYFLTFIDDYSRKTWIFPMKAKGEVFSRFKEFKAEVENLTERKIKTLRSDNGGEYTSGDFTDFCKEAGIKREYTVPYNPQQNGVVERKNRAILEAMKAMIHDQDLPMYLWGEACSTTVYVQNRSPHRVEDMVASECIPSLCKPLMKGHLS